MITAKFSKVLKSISPTNITNFKDTVCTADVVQVGLGDENGDFNFNIFLFNEGDEHLDIMCEVQLCLKSENCFAENDANCADHYTKQL